FRVHPPGAAADTYEHTMLPRRLGRRMDYDKAASPVSLQGKFYEFPDYEFPRGNLREFHGLPDAGNLCGGTKSPPSAGPTGKPPLSAADLHFLELIDDMYWPASFG